MTIPSINHLDTPSVSHLSKRRSLSKLSPEDLRSEASTLLQLADAVPKSNHGSSKFKNANNELDIDQNAKKVAGRVRVKSITEIKKVDPQGNETNFVKITYSDGTFVEEEKKKPKKIVEKTVETLPVTTVEETADVESGGGHIEVSPFGIELRRNKVKVATKNIQEALPIASVPNPQENITNNGGQENAPSQQDSPENYSRLSLLLFFLSLILIIAVGFGIFFGVKKHWDSIDSQNDNFKAPLFDGIEIDTNDGQNVLDALIASGADNDESTYTVQDMFQVLNSTGLEEKVVKKLLESQISKTIDQALENVRRNHGRVLEYTRKLVNVDENFVARVKGISLPCAIHSPTPSYKMTTHGKAAYAAFMFVSTSDAVPLEMDLNMYNSTFLLRSEVIENPTAGLEYFPTQYCLDTEYNYWNYGNDYFPSYRDSKRDVFVSFGNRAGSLAMSRRTSALFSARTSVSNIPKISDRLLSAYKTPKLELKAIVEAIDNTQCQTYNECKNQAKQTYLNKGITLNDFALDTALQQYIYMTGVLSDWRKESSSLGLMDAPFIFDSNIATPTKNSIFMIFDKQLNPYFSTKDLNNLIVDSGKLGDDLAKTLQEKSSNDNPMTTNALVSALQFPVAMKRRVKEFGIRGKDQIPFSTLKEMGVYGNMSDVEENVWNFVTSSFSNQKLKYNNRGQLSDGDLTSGVIGKSAEWFLVSPFDKPKILQDLIQRYMESVPSSYSRAMNNAYDADHPCNSTANTLDYYLLLLGSFAAIFGGIQALILSLHRCLHWWNKIIRKCFNMNESQVKPMMGIKRILPTYELVLIFIAWCSFFGLQIPLINQTIIERRASAYKSKGYDIVVEYSKNQILVNGGPGLAIVNLVSVDTYCDGANPDLYLITTIVCVVLGIIVNAELVRYTGTALKRYWKRICVGEPQIPLRASILSYDLEAFK